MKKWATTYLATMKLVTNKSTLIDVLGELMLEYKLDEANPFAAAEKDAGGGDDAAAEDGGGEEEEKEDKKPKEDSETITIKFDPSAVKKYNTNTNWRSGEGTVKKVTKKGIEADVEGNTIIINFSDLTEITKGLNETLFKKKLQEEENKLDPEDEKQIKDLESQMGSIANELGSAFDSAQGEIEKEVEEMPEKKLDEHKQKLNEAIGVTAVIGFILALPKLVEIITKSIAKLVKLIKKLTGAKKPETEEEQAQWAQKIVDFTHKWHKLYIKAFYYMFKMSGLYKKAGIKSPALQMKVANIFYYTIVAGLAIAAGVGAIGAFKTGVSQAAHGGEFAVGTFESVMAAVKSGEVASFLAQLGIEATELT